MDPGLLLYFEHTFFAFITIVNWNNTYAQGSKEIFQQSPKIGTSIS